MASRYSPPALLVAASSAAPATLDLNDSTQSASLLMSVVAMTSCTESMLRAFPFSCRPEQSK